MIKMDVNWLLGRLKTVETCTITRADGTTYEDTRAPSSLNLKAARVIEELAKQLENSRQVEKSLMNQLTQAYAEIDNLQRSKTAE